ncbi:hypothetical protein AHAS_Ahas04G0167800 [Arachis hypogaea]
MEGKQMGMNDILPPELIHRIFLRVPAKDLFHLRFVSKLWHSLISDRDFVESHYNLYSAASSHSYFFLVKDTTKSACFVEFDTLFDVAAAPTTLRGISPFQEEARFSFSSHGILQRLSSFKRTTTFSCYMEPTNWIQQNNILLSYRFSY